MNTMDDFAEHFEDFIAPREISPDEELRRALAAGWVVERDGRYVITDEGRRAQEEDAPYDRRSRHHAGGTVMTCKYQVAADEAVRIDDDGEHSTQVWICEWPDQYPERFESAPRWLLKLVGAGLAIQPERDCIGCNGYCVESRP